MRILQTTPNNYLTKTNSNIYNNVQKNKNFCIKFGSAPTPANAKKFMDPIEDSISKGFAWIMQTKTMENIIRKTDLHKTNQIKKIEDYNAKDPSVKKQYNDMLFSHLIVLGSTILSAFYVLKTVTNKKLDEARRKTLAINQGAVYALSTIMAYTFDQKLNKTVDKVIDNYKKANEGKVLKANLDMQVSGIKRAKSIIVIDAIYRFIAPVAITPLANYIGNKLQDKKESEIVFGNKK